MLDELGLFCTDDSTLRAASKRGVLAELRSMPILYPREKLPTMVAANLPLEHKTRIW